MSTTERAQSDLKKLKSKYSSQLSTLKELFTEWTDDDLLFTLQDADGDLELAIDRISEGHANQWGEVKTKKSKKEAAAANKANLETSVSSAAPSTTTYPSYSNTTSRQSKPLKPRSSAASSSTAAAATSSPSSRSAHHPKSHAVAWQSSKKADFDGWNTPQQKTDDGNGWNTAESSAPKKISSTPSSSTKTSNAHGGGAKTWASLLQSKAEPEPVKKPVTNDLHDASEKELPPLQKVDDAWLSGPTPTNDSLNQWDQPIQDTPTKSSLSPSSSPPVTTSTTSTTAATTSTAQPQVKKALDDDIPINFNSLSLKEKENVPEISSNHPSVADLLNSVKQQEQTPTSQPVQQQATEHQSQPHQHQQQQQPYHQQQQPTEQQLYHQMYQQQQQQHQYQQFGMHGYGNAFNAGYGIYGNSTNGTAAADSFFQPSSGLFNNHHQQHHDNDANVNNSTKTTSASTTTTAAANGGIPAVNDVYSQQSQYNNMQSFYPYYYMQNQFNGYPSYGQPSLNPRYDQPGAGSLSNSMASPYGGASSAYSSQLYGGFDDFGLGSTTHQNTTATSPDANKKATAATAASATSSIQQPYANYFNGQSPMFSSYGQQNRNSGNQQYWNQ